MYNTAEHQSTTRLTRLAEQDTASSRHVAVINEAFARANLFSRLTRRGLD